MVPESVGLGWALGTKPPALSFALLKELQLILIFRMLREQFSAGFLAWLPFGSPGKFSKAPMSWLHLRSESLGSEPGISNI